MMSSMKVVVLLSGGLDSVTLLHWAVAEHEVVTALSFHYGSRHNDRELAFAEWQAQKLGVAHETVVLDFIGRHFSSDLLGPNGSIPKGPYAEDNLRKTVVPFRNGIFLSVAAGIAESRRAQGVAIAAHAGDHAIYPDCREEYLDAQAEAIRLGTHAGIQILRPFVSVDKAGIVRRGAGWGVDFSMTWSCYEGGVLHCGECGTCLERRAAFQAAGIADPTRYLTSPSSPC